MRVLFYTASFTAHRGGVEKRFCLVANELVERGIEVRVLTARDEQNPRPKFPLHPSVIVHFAKVEKESVRPLLEEFQPDIVITVNGRKTSHLLSQLAAVNSHVVITEQRNPRDMSKAVGSEPLRLENLGRADRIHMLLPSYRRTLPPELFARCVVVPNQCSMPAEPADSYGRSLAPGQKKRIVCMARLHRTEKRQQVLVDAFAKIHRRFPDWELWLWGDHHDLRTLFFFRGLVLRRGLRKKTKLAGPTDDVTQEYLKAQLLVFPSPSEGFPQALLQGMACGLPCIGFADCPGVNELIVDGVTGLLAPGTDDPDALAQKMEALMSNPGLRERYGLAGREMARDYTYERFRDGWLELIDHLYRDRMSGIPPVAKSLAMVADTP